MSAGILIHAPREGSDAHPDGDAPGGIQISIHAPREGSDRIFKPSICPLFISIHAPREGSDAGAGRWLPLAREISIHAPREGSDGRHQLFAEVEPVISIHAPREGSDTWGLPLFRKIPHFYPRSPRGERRAMPSASETISEISIHAPREGSDKRLIVKSDESDLISIHAPREGSDSHRRR